MRLLTQVGCIQKAWCRYCCSFHVLRPSHCPVLLNEQHAEAHALMYHPTGRRLLAERTNSQICGTYRWTSTVASSWQYLKVAKFQNVRIKRRVNAFFYVLLKISLMTSPHTAKIGLIFGLTKYWFKLFSHFCWRTGNAFMLLRNYPESSPGLCSQQSSELLSILHQFILSIYVMEHYCPINKWLNSCHIGHNVMILSIMTYTGKYCRK